MNEHAAHSTNAEVMMRKIFAILALMFSVTAWAGDLEDAWDAAERGDYATAIVKYKIAAEQGSATAQNNLGVMNEKGQGVVQDYAEAVRWYKLAAAQGLVGAQNNLGQMYDKGRGVLQDYATALRLYKVAAAQGDSSAQNNLGAMYGLGKGVAQDYVRAHLWFNLAAATGRKDSTQNRDLMAKKMTPQQIAEAQKLARECQARNYKNCD